MTFSLQKADTEYSVLVEPVGSLALARRGDVVLAKSDKALVLHETRRPSTVYFPMTDIRVIHTRCAAKRSFCPIKGTATWFDLRIGESEIRQAAWCYETPQPEIARVQHLLAFDPYGAADIIVDGQPLKQPSHGHMSGPLVDWILRDAPRLSSPEALTSAIGDVLNDHGISISRLSVFNWSLHPLVAGQNHIWLRHRQEVVTFTASYDILETPGFVNSPMRYAAQGLGGVRQRLDGSPLEFEFPVFDDLKKKGVTDYAALPMATEQGPSNLLTLACDHPDGFTTADLGVVSECADMLGRLYENFALRDNARALLNTYLGRRTAARVLSGEIRRGDGDTIDAAILFCDLRDSTALEKRLSRGAYLSLLNAFFEVVTETVFEHGGEVMKFIGDAVLAIFPAEEGPRSACQQASQTALEVLKRVQDSKRERDMRFDCATGIAFGEVTYGNVGSLDRLDFTVIGEATNLAARMAEYSKTVAGGIVAAGEHAWFASDHAQPLGEISVRGIDEKVTAWSLRARTP